MNKYLSVVALAGSGLLLASESYAAVAVAKKAPLSPAAICAAFTEVIGNGVLTACNVAPPGPSDGSPPPNGWNALCANIYNGGGGFGYGDRDGVYETLIGANCCCYFLPYADMHL